MITPYYNADGIFDRPLSDAERTALSDQTQAHRLIDQFYYDKPGFVPLDGYPGPGYGLYQWPWSLGFIGPSTWSHPVYYVDKTDPTQVDVQQVAVYFHDQWGYHPYADSEGVALQAKFNAVPMPKTSVCPVIARAGAGSNWSTLWSGPLADGDHHMVIVDRYTCECWEGWLWTTQLPAAIRSAFPNAKYGIQWGGYIPDVEQFNGVLPNRWGGRATSLGEIGGLITYQDVWDAYYGVEVKKAIAIGCPMNSGKAVAPATRGDGPGANNVKYVPGSNPPQLNPAYGHDATNEGQWFTFPKDMDFSANPYPLARQIAERVRDFGMIIGDTSGAVGFYLEDGRTFGSPFYAYGPDAPDPWSSLDWTKVQPGADPRWGAVPTGQSVLHTIDWTKLIAIPGKVS